MTEKFIGYFQLVEACDQPGCPVCRCLEEDSRRELRTLLYEQVTDPETRRRLRESWGFCNWHTWMLLDAESVATGAAILYEDLLRVCRNRIERLRDRPPRAFVRLFSWLAGVVEQAPARILPRVVEHYRERARCPICARLRFTEAHYTTTLVEFADDAQFDRAYQQSAGLCLPHLLHALELGRGAAGLARILDRTLGKWESLRHDLERFVAKNEYRNTAPITAAEADSYHRAFEVMAGRRGLFGTDLHRGSAGVPRVEDPSPVAEQNALAARALEDLRIENRRLREALAAARSKNATRGDDGGA
jgi:hypothetical protein